MNRGSLAYAVPGDLNEQISVFNERFSDSNDQITLSNDQITLSNRSSDQDTLLDQPLSNISAPDQESIFTTDSGHTLHSPAVFGYNVEAYNRILQFPIQSNFNESVAFDVAHQPWLVIHTKFSFFLQNKLILVISKYENGEKKVFCKVYFKIEANNLTTYNMDFVGLGIKLTLINNGLKPFIDLMYKGNKIRINTNPLYNDDVIKLAILHNLSPSLCDNQTMKSSVARHDSASLHSFLQKEKFLVTFANITSASTKINGVKIDGFINVLHPNTDSVTDALVITSILLLLRHQQIKKMKGNQVTQNGR